MNDSIMLNSGKLFDILNPENCEITIEDIAHGLSNICRYVGQCNKFFSVAEHSVLVSKIATNSKLAALFHDAAEAFIGDVSSPLKNLLPEYRKIEEKIEKTIFNKFDIEWPPDFDVKQADYIVMYAEQKILMPVGTNEWLKDMNLPPKNVHIQGLAPKEAYILFIERYQYLTTSL